MFLKKFLSGVAAKFLYSYLADLVVDLIIDRLVKFRYEIDFEKVEVDAIKIIREKVNFFFLEEILISLLKVLLKYAEIALEDVITCQDVWNAIRQGNFKAAAKQLKKLILSKVKSGV